jgi:hypothetical protein
METSGARQPVHAGLGDINVLLNRAPAHTDSTEQEVVFVQRQPTTEDHQTSIGLLDPVQCLVRLGLVIQSSTGNAIKQDTRSGFLHTDVNAAWERVVHA